MLLAGVSGAVPVRVHEPIQSRDHTERLLRSLGVELRQEASDGGWMVALNPSTETLPPLDLQVPGDFSSAAFFIALATLASAGGLCIRGVGVNPTRTGLLPVLGRMGANVAVTSLDEHGGEPTADLLVRPAALRAANVGAAEIPSLIDEVPVLAVMAARADGDTIITGAAELRLKESDRLYTIVRNLRAIGVDAEELPDGLAVRGTGRPLVGAVETRGDHRIAMAFGVLAALPENQIEIDDAAAAGVSFPGFWELLRRVVK
jgi:3-phosphoshikimate 1-carboxyvinyltransferase